MDYGFKNRRLTVGHQASNWNLVYYEPVNDPDEEGEAESGYYKLTTGKAGFREPMEGEIKWLPLFDIANCESKNPQERKRLQKQFLTDAWRYCAEKDPEKVRQMEEDLEQPHFSRWRAWFKPAKKWKKKQMRARERRQSNKAAKMRAAGATEAEIQRQLKDDSDGDSAYSSDEEGHRALPPGGPGGGDGDDGDAAAQQMPPPPRPNKRKATNNGTNNSTNGRKVPPKKRKPNAPSNGNGSVSDTSIRMSGGLGSQVGNWRLPTSREARGGSSENQLDSRLDGLMHDYYRRTMRDGHGVRSESVERRSASVEDSESILGFDPREPQIRLPSLESFEPQIDLNPFPDGPRVRARSISTESARVQSPRNDESRVRTSVENYDDVRSANNENAQEDFNGGLDDDEALREAIRQSEAPEEIPRELQQEDDPTVGLDEDELHAFGAAFGSGRVLGENQDEREDDINLGMDEDAAVEEAIRRSRAAGEHQAYVEDDDVSVVRQSQDYGDNGENDGNRDDDDDDISPKKEGGE